MKEWGKRMRNIYGKLINETIVDQSLIIGSYPILDDQFN